MIKLLDCKNSEFNKYIVELGSDATMRDKLEYKFYELSNLVNIFSRTGDIKYYGSYFDIVNMVKEIINLQPDEYREYHFPDYVSVICGTKDGDDFFIVFQQTSFLYNDSTDEYVNNGNDRNFIIKIISSEKICNQIDLKYIRTKLIQKYKFLNWVYVSSRRKHTKSIKIDKHYDIFDAQYPFVRNGIKKYVKDFFESDSSILLLTGPAGTGKTSFIRNMILDYDVAPTLTYDKTLMNDDEFLLDFLTNPSEPENTHLMIFEDSDELIASRKNGENNAIAKLLNVSDGIFKSKNKKFIFTTNITDLKNIDPALIRVGRCYDILNFRKLTIEECFAIVPPENKEKRAYIENNNGATVSELFNDLNDTNNAKYASKIGFI